MNFQDLQVQIEAAWEGRDTINAQTMGAPRDAVNTALGLLDTGKARVAEKHGKDWLVHQWLKKAVLLSFRLNDMSLISGGPGKDTNWWDKVPSKFDGWDAGQFGAAGFRAVPNCIVRRGTARISPRAWC